MSSSDALTLREATAADAGDILTLVRELADYEKLSHVVTGTPEDLARHLFGAQPCAYALMAYVGADLAGFSLYFFNYSTFLCRPGLYLEDLYVRPRFRRHGIGRAMLADLARRAVARDCGRMEWAVLDWNAPAIQFYRELGARPHEGWTTFRLGGDALSRLAGA